jgi:hypothetical protein
MKMNKFFEMPMTWLMIGLCTIAAVVGGAVVIWGDPGTLSFAEYLDTLWKFALAAAGVAVARGVAATK